jgi:D-alanine transfer protein
MLPSPETPAARPHLAAALSALLIAGAALALGLLWCRGLEQRYVAGMAADFSDTKLHGAALQKQAIAENDLLVLYGSSELLKEVPNQASEFFEDYPTGFRVFPVGKAGTTALAVLQKLAAVGPSLSGRKVAISLSPSSYFSAVVDPGYYAGNFSELQATELAFSTALSPGLKRDAARRMIAYTATIEDNWLLDFALHRLAHDTVVDRALYTAIVPLGRLQMWIARAQDHFEAAGRIVDLRHEIGDVRHQPRRLDWGQVFKGAERIATAMKPAGKSAHAPVRHAHGSRDRDFLRTLADADEWTDLELMLRALGELGAKPLILSMPVHGGDLEAVGVSRAARGAYLTHLRDVTSRHRAPLVYFQNHEEDPAFFLDNFDHLGVKGWAYYNKTLDDFYHDRLLNL